jgi:hypothetical protein
MMGDVRDEERAVSDLEVVDAEDSAGAGQSAQVDIIRPVAASEEVLAAWQQFQELKRSLLTLDDYQEVQGRARIKKSGWRKIAAAFGISDAVLREERRECEGATGSRYFVWEITARAIAPNGRYSDAVGSCASNERRFAHAEHDVRATAHTRAKNRAVADLVGGGEVSAEELDAAVVQPVAPSEDQGQERSPQSAAPRATPPAAARIRETPTAIGSTWAGDRATEGQLKALRAHLARTRTDERTICADAGVAALEALGRKDATDLISRLSRQPNVA